MKSLEHVNSKTLTKLKTFYTFQSMPLQFPLSRINYHMIYEKIVKSLHLVEQCVAEQSDVECQYVLSKHEHDDMHF